MTTETPQPTCPICGQEDCVVNHPDPSHMVTHTEYLADVVEHWKLGYEWEKAAREAIERAAKELRDDLVLAREARAEERRRALEEAEKERDERQSQINEHKGFIQRLLEAAGLCDPQDEDDAVEAVASLLSQIEAAESASAEERRRA